MRWSHCFIPTLKETPTETAVISLQLLVRAGMIRKLNGGTYAFLPLGVRVIRKIEKIVREEMESIGAHEILIPLMHPYESGQEKDLLVTTDCNRKEWVLTPANDSVIIQSIAGEIKSYRQLPKLFFQIQSKFRDELRPRSGLLRTKEFILKNAYSIDASKEKALSTYQKAYSAYVRAFQRCGLQAVAVEAVSDGIGESTSHEFVIFSPLGENEVILCTHCNYAATIEKAESRESTECMPESSSSEEPQIERIATPGVVTIEALSQPPYGVAPYNQIKTLVYWIEGQPTLILLRGDHMLNESKLSHFLGTNRFRPAEPQEIFDTMGAYAGSLGAAGIAQIPILADMALKGRRGMVTGANIDGFHIRNVTVERDIHPTHWLDLRKALGTDYCARCGQKLKIQTALAVGHLSILGSKPSEIHQAFFVDELTQQHPLILGCYNLGISRTFQAIVDQSCDKDGIAWPWSIAPFAVCLTPLNISPDSQPMKWAETYYQDLRKRGIDVLLDDRDERPGVKFKDADLIGCPIRLTLGDKSLNKNEVEIKIRGGSIITCKVDQAISQICDLVYQSCQGMVS